MAKNWMYHEQVHTNVVERIQNMMKCLMKKYEKDMEGGRTRSEKIAQCGTDDHLQ